MRTINVARKKSSNKAHPADCQKRHDVCLRKPHTTFGNRWCATLYFRRGL